MFTSLTQKLQERDRQILLTIALKTSIFTGGSGLAALMVGGSPAQSATVFIPSMSVAICTSKKRWKLEGVACEKIRFAPVTCIRTKKEPGD